MFGQQLTNLSDYGPQGNHVPACRARVPGHV